MTFREKHLWISIASTLGVWGFYYLRLFQTITAGGLESDDFAEVMGGLFVGCLFVSVLIEIVLTIVASVTTSKAEREARDEREMLAALKASHVSLMFLMTVIGIQAAGAYFAGLIEPTFGAEPGFAMTSANAMILMANILLGAVIVSEMIRHGFTLALLRRGR